MGAGRLRAALAALALGAALPSPSAAEVRFSFGGRIQSDIRFRVQEKAVGGWYARRALTPGVARNENILKGRLEVEAGRFTGVAEVDLVWQSYVQRPDGFADLADRRLLAPFRLEAHAGYVEATDIFVDGLDLRVGQQIVAWGVGDQFNPTNVVNANDLEDPLLFGEQLANLMVRADYTFGEEEDWSISAVVVPIFRPALLPRSATLALASLDRLPFTDDALRWRVQAEQALARALGFPAVVRRATPVVPEPALENIQYAARLAGVVAGQDLALSYYWGRLDMPQPFANVSRQRAGRRCDPAGGGCIDGTVDTDVYLYYPRVHMVGFNAAGQIPLDWIADGLEAIGYRVELGVFFPRSSGLALLQQGSILGVPGGEYDYDLASGAPPATERPLVLESAPYAKWVVGLDYTFSRHLYVNLQWVHGFPDEAGAGDFFREGWSVRRGGAEGDTGQLLRCAQLDARRGERCAVEWLRPRLGDYLVVGADLKLLDERLLVRLFVIWDLTGVWEERWDAAAGARARVHHGPFSSAGASAVIFPEVTYSFGNGLDLSAGAFLMLGEPQTKFGDPAAGGSQIWTRARFAF